MFGLSPVYIIIYNVLHPALHTVRHAVKTTVSVKNPSSAPDKIAPSKLVAAKVIPRSTSERKIVPSIPTKRVVRTEHIQDLSSYPSEIDVIRRLTPRYTTPIPKITHKKAGVRVIVALNVKNAVIIATIILATTPIPTHP